jgi:DNA-binding response OmpR family regulator
MTKVLIVEDSSDQALMMRGLLDEAGFSCEVATDGRAALDALEHSTPDIIVTDLVMPELDGLKLVEITTEKYPSVPVILVTAFGSGEVAVRALKKGAASYIPKRRLVSVLVSTVEDVLSVAREQQEQVRLLDYLDESIFRFRLGNDQEVIAGLVSFLQDQLRVRYSSCTETICLQVGVAIREALRNAMHHGNLEVDSELRRTTSRDYDAMVEERLADSAFGSREVALTATFSTDGFRCTVGDQGKGFDPADVPDPTDPENLLRASGRGLYLISAFMDEVVHNEVGNEITMVKRMKASADGERREADA